MDCYADWCLAHSIHGVSITQILPVMPILQYSTVSRYPVPVPVCHDQREVPEVPWALAMTLMRQTTGLLPVLPVSEVFCHEDIPSFSLVAWNVCDRLPLLSDSRT